jgi:hypothetical protein
MGKINFEIAIETIKQAIHKLPPINGYILRDVNSLLSYAENGYVLAKWPESQDYMDDEEAIFCGGSEEKTGSSAYFVPIKKIINKD